MGIHRTTSHAVLRTLIGVSSYAIVSLHAGAASADTTKVSGATSNRAASGSGQGPLPELTRGASTTSTQPLAYEPADMGTTRNFVPDTPEDGTGLIELRATRRQADAAPDSLPEEQMIAESSKDAFVVRRREATTDGRLQMESALGDQMLNTNPVVGAGYRNSLPRATMRGISASGASSESQVNWSLGQTGRLVGSSDKSFVADGARVAGVGVNQQVLEGWHIGAQAWTLQDEDDAMDPSAAAAIRYVPKASNHDAEYALRALVDDSDSWGVMLDGDIKSDRLVHRAGLFRLEPDVNWAGQSVPSDTEGGYWHTELAMGRHTWNGGIEAERNNIRRNPARTGLNVARAFSGFSHRVSEQTVLNGEARSEFERNVTGLPGEDRDLYQLKLSMDRPLPAGPARLALSWTGDFRTDDREETVGLSWEQNWLESDAGTLRSRFDLNRTTHPDGARYRPTASMAVGRPLGRGTDISGAVFYTPKPGTGETDPFPDAGCAVVDACPHGTGSSIWLALNKAW